MEHTLKTKVLWIKFSQTTNNYWKENKNKNSPFIKLSEIAKCNGRHLCSLVSLTNMKLIALQILEYF